MKNFANFASKFDYAKIKLCQKFFLDTCDTKSHVGRTWTAAVYWTTLKENRGVG